MDFSIAAGGYLRFGWRISKHGLGSIEFGKRASVQSLSFVMIH